jgi:hypothetical protein
MVAFLPIEGFFNQLLPRDAMQESEYFSPKFLIFLVCDIEL